MASILSQTALVASVATGFTLVAANLLGDQCGRILMDLANFLSSVQVLP